VKAMDSTDKGLFMGLAILISLTTIGMLLICLFAKPVESEKHKEKTCQDLGGKYIVVDKQFVGKGNYMNIYGCVK
jgi:hypothetical protein